jgi:hypothetical protein
MRISLAGEIGLTMNKLRGVYLLTGVCCCCDAQAKRTTMRRMIKQDTMIIGYVE